MYKPNKYCDFSLALAKIIEKAGRFYIYSKDGSKKLGGPYKSHEFALKRLKQIEYFNNK